jgi:hypothetical protein
MKNKNLYYSLAPILMLGAAVLHILHVPYAMAAMLVALCLGYLVQLWHVRQLEKKLGNTADRPRQPVQNLIPLVLLVIAGILHLNHVPYANFILVLAFVIGSLIRGRYIRQLERRAEELGLA